MNSDGNRKATGHRIRAIGALLLALFAIGHFTSEASAGTRPLKTGVTVIDFTNTSEAGYKRIRSTGATLTRVIITWPLVVGSKAPANPSDPADPAYSWGHYDTQIQNAVNAGLTVLVQINGAPKWAERCKTQSTTATCNPNPVAFARFARAAATRYSGTYEGLPRIRYWEPLNEPNLESNFLPQRRSSGKQSPVLYRSVLNRFAAAVKGVDPTNLVVGGGLSPLGGGNSYHPLAFARQLLCMQGRSRPTPIRGCSGTARFDIWASNPYTTGGPTHKSTNPDDIQLGDLSSMSRLLRAARKAGKIRSSFKSIPYWLTEFSWDSNPPDPGGVKMPLLKRWTAHAMFQAWRSGVSAFFWFSLRDIERIKDHPYSWTLESGLYQRGNSLSQDQPKGTLKAFRFPVVAFRRPAGIYFWGRNPGG
ncbi:MAG TPA: cellulase family glycosylhydrolase, partial [Solirubrobacterales bacterium]|nr:cellulase family glycosylhydrolase [Solirubrobacterales bacterium]